VIVKKAPNYMWYSDSVGKVFNVIGYSEDHEAYMVDVPRYTGRFIYSIDCEEIPDNVSTTFDVDFTLSPKITDSVVEEVIGMFRDRSEVGIKKYGTTLEQNNTDDFLLHLQQELMDAILYIQKLRR